MLPQKAVLGSETLDLLRIVGEWLRAKDVLELAPAELALADLEGQERAQEPIDEPRLRRRLRDDPETQELGDHLASVVNGNREFGGLVHGRILRILEELALGGDATRPLGSCRPGPCGEAGA
jgi:hypothetical protein